VLTLNGSFFIACVLFVGDNLENDVLAPKAVMMQGIFFDRSKERSMDVPYDLLECFSPLRLSWFLKVSVSHLTNELWGAILASVCYKTNGF